MIVIAVGRKLLSAQLARRLGAGIATLAALTTCSTPARAVDAHRLRSTFNASDNPNYPSGFGSPTGVAVDNSSSSSDPSAGDVYVSDEVAGVVDKLNANGEFICQISSTMGTPASTMCGSETTPQVPEPLTPYGLAVDPANGDLYVANAASSVVDEFGPTGLYLGQVTGASATAPLAPGPFGLPLGVAVDPSDGDVYVSDLIQNVIDEFTSTGTYLTQFGGEGSAVGELRHPRGLAVDSQGHVYVADTENGRVEKFDSTGLIDSEHPVTDTGGSTAVAVDPSSNDPFTVDTNATPLGNPSVTCNGTSPSNYVAHYTQDGAPIFQFGFGTFCETHAISVSGTGYVYVADELNRDVDIFESIVLPDVATEGPTNIQSTSATVAGTVNPERTLTTSQVDYGTTLEYGETIATSPNNGEEGSGEANIQVTAELTDLIPNTLYHYRFAASNENGLNPGQDNTVHTALSKPTIDGPLEASDISPFEATVRAKVNPENSGTTTYHVEYGLTSAYGHVFAPDGDAGAAFGDTTVEQVLGGLQPDTNYHYALVATNAQGSVMSPDQTLTTRSAVAPAVTTGQVFGVTTSTASVSGTINPEGLQTTYAFELGPSTSYTTRVFGEAGSGTTEEAVTTVLADLQPGTTYHYRLTATNAAGTTYGTDEAFTTTTFPSSGITPPTPLAFIPTPVFPNVNTGPVAPPTKPPTRAQKLKKALKHCRKDRKKAKRAACEKKVRDKYGAIVKMKH